MGPISSTTLEVSWEAPTESCTVTVESIHYRLTNRGQCQPLDSDEGEIQLVSETNITLKDLHPYSSYEIQVRTSGGLQTVSAITDEAGA